MCSSDLLEIVKIDYWHSKIGRISFQIEPKQDFSSVTKKSSTKYVGLDLTPVRFGESAEFDGRSKYFAKLIVGINPKVN